MKNKPLLFNTSATSLSLGVELELQVLDGETLQLTPRAHEIIERVGSKQLKKEFFQSTLEVVSNVCADVHDAKRDLTASLSKVQTVATSLGLKIASTGTHPEADYRDRVITPASRYHELADRNQWMIRRMAVYGMHVHIGMPSADDAISFSNFLLHFTPHVLALSASSPFWQRIDTGLASARPTMYESLPTSGMPYVVKNWKQFQQLYDSLLRTQSISSMKDLWWDIRPSPFLGTVELRICDQPATLSETLAIVSFVHLLAHWYFDHKSEWDTKHKTIKRWVLRENKWRTIRFGLDAEIIEKANAKPVKLTNSIESWLKKFEHYTAKLGYEEYVKTIYRIIEQGNSSHRQNTVYQQHNDLHEVVRFNVREFEQGLLGLITTDRP